MAVDVHIAGHLAFVASREDGLYITDVSDPAHPWRYPRITRQEVGCGPGRFLASF
ncbi:MAG: hypothetical protein IPH87_09400 [Anaerolineae bacterium]|nr:hypothetical protein [Anaerolineae bacterium]